MSNSLDASTIFLAGTPEKNLAYALQCSTPVL